MASKECKRGSERFAQVRCVVLAVCIAAGMATPSAAATWHVAPTGDDASGDGSQAAPWREIRRALQAVQPGDTVVAEDGSYRGFTVESLGAADAPIVIRAAGRSAEILPTHDRGGQYDPDNIAVWNSTNVVIDGFRSFAAPRAAVRIVSSSRITVRNGTYGNNGIWAVGTTHSDDVVVENCDLYGSRSQHGIYFANSGDRPVARGNRIHHNFGSGIRAFGDSTQGGDGLISGGLFEGNRIHGNYGGAGLNFNAVQDSAIRNNLIVANHASSGIALFMGEGNVGVGGIAIEHNTIDVPADGKYALRILGVQGSITLRNNILHNRNAAKGPYSWGSPADAAGTDGDHDVVGGGLWVSTDDEATRQSWASWQDAGHEPASSVADAAGLSADEARADYHLRPGSPAIDVGLTLASVTADIEGRARPAGAASDVGAYESAPASSPSCGDGQVQSALGEECDDGNRADGDCCSSACRLEPAGASCDRGDVCLGAGVCDGGGTCGAAAPPDCGSAWSKGSLVVNESVAGRESLALSLGGGPARSQVDFGDPLSPGGTRYSVCLYGDGDAPVGRIDVDRAGETCGRRSCWQAAGGRPPGGRGYAYRDRDRAASGVETFTVKGGSDGKPAIVLKARNDAASGQTGLPTGIAAALAGSTSATVRVFASDASRCTVAKLEPVAGSSAGILVARR